MDEFEPLRRIHWSEAEALAGKRLDRRLAYSRDGDMLLESCSWTAECSGCDGGGCSECGYHGKTRRAQWVPSPHSKVITI